MSAVVEPLDDWRLLYGKSAQPSIKTIDDAKAFADWLVSFQRRPWDWVLACYPWGVDGSPLESKAPELWQREYLQKMQSDLQALPPMSINPNAVLRYAVAAGNGVGKSGLVAWLVHWFVSCFPRGQAVVTAGTENQLDAKTWREVAKWHELALNAWQIEWTATRYRNREHPDLWFAAKTAWSATNADAFAGTHEHYVLILFDEASAIDKIIWDTVEGALTTGLCFFLVFGNPTTLSGGFYKAFHGPAAAHWKQQRVDARAVSFANHKELQSWIDTWGINSDFVRVHVYGQFPSQSDASFIGADAVQDAMHRPLDWRNVPRSLPKIMGVDFSRGNSDLNAIVRRQGRKVGDKIKVWHDRDAIRTAHVVAAEINSWRPDVVICDGVGLGGPIIDYLRRIGFGRMIIDAQSGSTPSLPEDRTRYANMRAVIWARLRDAMPTLSLPADDAALAEEICAPRFDFRTSTQLLIIESKEHMLHRGVNSPNKADALALTFWTDLPNYTTPGASTVVCADDI